MKQRFDSFRELVGRVVPAWLLAGNPSVFLTAMILVALEPRGGVGNTLALIVLPLALIGIAIEALIPEHTEFPAVQRRKMVAIGGAFLTIAPCAGAVTATLLTADHITPDWKYLVAIPAAVFVFLLLEAAGVFSLGDALQRWWDADEVESDQRPPTRTE